ncbi:DUF2997 domain-containing protein [Candidatus Bathyarchaeota archaeon]|nr:DUF2997 domain-containing protein [Candidatus Bathyarchaeota archaeon]
MREILVEIDKEGRATVKTQGFQGPACTEAVKRLAEKLRAMGIEVDQEKQTLTPEYYLQQQTQTQKVRV